MLKISPYLMLPFVACLVWYGKFDDIFCFIAQETIQNVMVHASKTIGRRSTHWTLLVAAASMCGSHDPGVHVRVRKKENTIDEGTDVSIHTYDDPTIQLTLAFATPR